MEESKLCGAMHDLSLSDDRLRLSRKNIPLYVGEEMAALL